MTRYTAFRCPENLLEKAKAKASRDRRSLSNYIITLIERDVTRNGERSKIKTTRAAAAVILGNRGVPLQEKVSKRNQDYPPPDVVPSAI